MSKCHQKNFKQESKFFLMELKSKGSRITEQRKSMVEAIINFSEPFTADELLKKLGRHSINLTTVYRSLSTFNKMGLISVVYFSDGVLRYEYLSKGSHHHHHIICTDCKTIEPIDLCVAKEQEKRIAKMGYTNISHRLEFFGLCQTCNSH